MKESRFRCMDIWEPFERPFDACRPPKILPLLLIIITCQYIYMHTCSYTRTFICMYIIYIKFSVRVCVCACVRVYVCVCVCVCVCVTTRV